MDKKVKLKKEKILERINFLEEEMRSILSKKAVGKAIDIQSYRDKINLLKKEYVNLK